MLYSSLDATAYANLASINTDNVVLSTEDLEHHAFPVMHHINVVGAYVYGNMPGGIEPLPAWMTINGDITSSLNWNAYSHPMDLATISTNAPNQVSCTIASSNKFPFYLNSGATTYLSPSCKDFFMLQPIASHPVKGVRGTLIFATSIREIHLHIAQGAWIILLDILFIPTVMVRLISVGAIAQDSKIISHFEDASCWLTSKSTSAIIARGTLLPKTCLYSLPLHAPQADHAYTIHCTPDLETWHCRLGHANYQSVTSMACKGKINSMSPSLTNSKVSKCESCVLGKWTKTIIPKTRGGKESDGNYAT